MTTLACLAAFVGASACWGAIGYVLGRKSVRRGLPIYDRHGNYLGTAVSMTEVSATPTLAEIGLSVAYMPCDGDAALDAEIEGSK